MIHHTLLVFVTCSMVLSIPGTILAQASDTTGKALDPKATAVGFYSELAKGDVERASSFLLQPEKMKEWIRSQTQLSASFEHWNEVVEAKLGERGSSIILPNPIRLMADRSQRVDAKVKGDVAEFPITKNKPMKLRRIGKSWKLDIFSAYETPETLKTLGVKKGEEALSLVVLKSREQSKMLDLITKEIEAGQLTTADQVRGRMRTERDAINERMLQALQNAAIRGRGRASE